MRKQEERTKETGKEIWEGIGNGKERGTEKGGKGTGRAAGLKKTPDRTYKSRLFIRIFEDKKELLSLYNAVSGKHYTDPEALEINTLENAIYMSMKNDLSFLIDSRLSLYEHQSTYSPNLPLRFLLYLSDIYSAMTRDVNLYGTKKVGLPPPRFLIFYNGQKEEPDRKELRLSDLYTAEEESHQLELKAVMININLGHNPELMSMCGTLREYAEYTERVRRYAGEMELSEAVERAITECIREGILEEFLRKNRMEAKRMSIYEYDEEKHMRQEREAAWEEGRIAGEAAGKEEGIWEGEQKKLCEQVKKKLAKGKSEAEIAEELEEEETVIKELMEKYGL